MNPKFSIVIPVYNSEKNIEKLYKDLIIELEKITNEFEVIFVDDFSQDSSFKILENLSLKDKRIVVIKLERNFGQQNAIYCGLNYTKGNYVVNLDDDLQHNPKYINDMYLKLLDGYDIVYAVTKIKYHKKYRNIGSKLTDKLFNLLLKKPPSKRVSSYRIMKKELVNKILMEKRSYNYISASILKYTKNIGNYYYKHSQRKFGTSNYTFIKQLKIFIRIYIYYSENILIKKIRINKEPYKIDKIIDRRWKIWNF